MHGSRSVALAIAIAILLAFGSPRSSSAQGAPAMNPPAADNSTDEGWSFDDIKDVFEAIHFLAITVGIGVGVWWFVSRYLSQASILTLDLDIGGQTSVPEGEQVVVELVAAIRNDGVSGARIRRCSFSVSSIDTGTGFRAGVLQQGAGLKPLFEGEFLSGGVSIAAGARVRLSTVVAIPHDGKSCLLTVRLEPFGNQPAVIGSRLLPSFRATSD
jgi:hypothetical protein